MEEKVFTQEQLSMLAECILARIKSWRDVEHIADGDLLELSKRKIGELCTLLNYINA